MSVSKKTPRAAARSTRTRVTSRSRAAAARQRFPAIEAFCDAYLNQDVHAIYGSPAAAADAFLADATAAEIRQLRAEWAAFRAALPRGASARSAGAFSTHLRGRLGPVPLQPGGRPVRAPRRAFV